MSAPRKRTSRATRRRFLAVLAAGSAAALAAPALALAQDAPAKSTAKKPAGSTPAPAPPAKPRTDTGAATAGGAAPRRIADPKEIEKLKGYVDASLKTLRDFPLPTGSPMAFVFKPARARRGKKGG